jgi:hypothetical protein
MTELVGLPVGALAPSALLGLTVLLILTDRLVWHKRLDALEQKVAEWQKEAEAWKSAADETSKQNAAMLRAFGPTLTDFLQGLRRAGVGTREDGEDS